MLRIRYHQAITIYPLGPCVVASRVPSRIFV